MSNCPICGNVMGVDNYCIKCEIKQTSVEMNDNNGKLFNESGKVDISTLINSIYNLNSIANITTEIKDLSSSINTIKKVASSINEINMVSAEMSNLTKINQVINHVEDIPILLNHLKVLSEMTEELKLISAVLKELGNVEEVMKSIKIVSDNIFEIHEIRKNIDELKKISYVNKEVKLLSESIDSINTLALIVRNLDEVISGVGQKFRPMDYNSTNSLDKENLDDVDDAEIPRNAKKISTAISERNENVFRVSKESKKDQELDRSLPSNNREEIIQYINKKRKELKGNNEL